MTGIEMDNGRGRRLRGTACFPDGAELVVAEAVMSVTGRRRFSIADLRLSFRSLCDELGEGEGDAGSVEAGRRGVTAVKLSSARALLVLTGSRS